ncbi:hypothetical protein SAMN05444372_10126 [Flavobacterium micromati]|jgi:hypothetical protein|uniref:Uncharacterized protein n=1 Tax=Flavobacterium micromati TaxID=229205 RepID=A0A1M5F9M1_9FLAO|nr:hypothetical protein SAMN05444372_10126 [Flavobacterium micromati]
MERVRILKLDFHQFILSLNINKNGNAINFYLFPQL